MQGAPQLGEPEAMRLRADVLPGDEAAVRRIVASTGFFHAGEIEIAAELVRERILRGLASGYRFLFAESVAAGNVVAYSCFGEIPCSVGSYDLYWIAVDAVAQRHGFGRRLLAATEDVVRGLGGRRLYIETSGRGLYRPTRAFYERCGYRLEAELADFYSPGDAKLIYVKALFV
jgi:ribosomal protein S18 acetylase RimI-like enzyme